MGSPLKASPVRAFIARCLLAEDRSASYEALGSIVLRPHQVSAVGRLRAAIDEFGGAFLCDQVGMGKTFVALALTDPDRDVCVVGPAVLREMWMQAGESANRRIVFTSTESLSRRAHGVGLAQDAGSQNRLVIVDEAHHFRHPLTKRYDSLARLVAKKDALLLSATPIHNKRRDLTVLLALFLGSEADGLDAADLGKIVVRRERSGRTEFGLPKIHTPKSLDVSYDEVIPQHLLDLPPPLPPRDGGDGGALLIHSLIRQWASSDAALIRALVRRLQRAASLTAALESGTYPSTSELSAWTAGDDCVQLAFAELVAQRSDFNEEMLAAVRSHSSAVADLLGSVRQKPSHDIERADLIRSIRRDHNGLSVVAFSQYSETVDALFRMLCPSGQVAVLTGKGARVAGGRITRADAIRRFAPNASGAAKPHPSEAVSLLLTTDLLSEGVNLQDAAVVIHLDLPWTPARMEQRLGRVARMGSLHERVFSYVIRPPVSAETLIHIETALREKMTASGIVVDDFQSLASLPGATACSDRNSPRMTEEIREVLEQWSGVRDEVPINAPITATVRGEIDGFIALMRVGDRFVLLVRDHAGLTTDPERILRVVRQSDGDTLPCDPTGFTDAREAIERHFGGLAATDSSHRAASTRSSTRRAALQRLGAIASKARPHERARLVYLATLARESLLSRIGVGDERRLAALSVASLPDDEWMQRLGEMGQADTGRRSSVTVHAMIVIRRTRDSKA